MFDHTSRYRSTEVTVTTGADGEPIAHLRRRFGPHPEGMQVLAVWPVQAGDRFDLVAARTLGDSQAFWRLADANRAMDPAELEAPGRRLVVPMPQAGDR